MASSGYFESFKPGDYAVRQAEQVVDFSTISGSSATGSLFELYNRSNKSSTGLIGRWSYVAGLGWNPIGEINLTNVTDSQWGQVTGSTPGLGPEVNTANDAAAPPTITETNTTGSWASAGTGVGGVLESAEGGAPTGGDYCIRLTTGTSNNNWRMFKVFGVSNATDYKISFWAKATNVNTQRVVGSGITPGISQNITNTEWEFFEFDVTTTSTNIAMTFIAELGTDPDNTRMVAVDGFSIRLNNNSSETPANQNTIALESGHSLPDGATTTVTVWSLTGSSEIATATSLYVTGNTGIFPNGSPAGINDNDIFHVEGLCEFGELRSYSNNGKWIPLSGSRAFWQGGLVATGTVAGSALGFIPTAGAGSNDAPGSYLMEAVCDLSQVGADNNSVLGVGKIGQLDGLPYLFGGCLYKTGGAWNRGIVFGDTPTPSLAGSISASDPHGETGINFSVAMFNNNDAINASYLVQSAGATLTPGNAQSAAAISLGGANWAAGTGPDQGVGFSLQAIGGGTVAMKCTSLFMRWRT